MSKRLLMKLALVMVTLGAMTLLQGCGEDDDLVYSFVWRSTGFAPTAGTSGVLIQVSSVGAD